MSEDRGKGADLAARAEGLERGARGIESAAAVRDELPRSVLDHLMEGCQVIGPDFRYLYVNDAAAAHGRTTRERLLGRTMTEAFAGIEGTEMFALLRRCLEQRAPGRMENEFSFADGERRWFELRFEPVPEGVTVLSLDITERKRADEALRRSSRALATLSECNQTLVRAIDEQQFMADVCRVVVERGGYRLAWIGMRDRNTPGAIRSVAHAGLEHGVDAVRPSGHGGSGQDEDPSSLALRSGKSSIARVDGADPQLVRWREEVRALGLGSCIALPITELGEPIGVLSIYATEPDAFDDGERALLDEMALDLAYGIASLRARAGMAQVAAERRQADDALRESEQRYRSLFDNTSMGIAHCRMLYDADRPVDFSYLHVNAAFEALTGLRGVTGRNVSEVLPGLRDSDPELLEIYGRVARTGVPERFEIRLQALGQWFDVSVYSPSRDYFVAVFDVVTKRKETEESLRRFSERLERLARVVQDLSQARSVEAIVDITRLAARVLVGADGATFVLRDGSFCHYVDEDAIEPLWKGKRFPLSACISGWTMLHRQSAVIEDIYADARIPHDAYRPTFVRSLVMVPIRSSDPIGAIGCYWAASYRASREDVRLLQALADSTSVAMENVRALAELAEGKATVRAIYDHLPNPTFVWRRAGDDFVLADFNEAASVATGTGVAGAVGKPPGEVPHELPHLSEDLASCFAHRVPVRREVECRMPGVTALRNLVLTYAFVPPDMVLLHTEDTTAQRRTDEQLRVGQRLEAVGRLAGGVAHDFNNLLSVILSYTGFALEALRAGVPLREDLEQVRTAAQRAASLTRQLLAFSRNQVLKPAVLDLNERVSDVEGMLRRLLREDIEIVVRLSGERGHIEADPGQLEQIIMNLAVNARDAMPGGGRLTIATAAVELDEPGAGTHGMGISGAFMVLSVTDTGCGMDSDTRARVFEPFFTTKEVGKGTGLGLSTVYGIVEQSGGQIRLHSEPGQGTTFDVYLPRVDAVSPAPRRSTPPALAVGDETVLVVEDEDAVRALAARILQSAGYRVLTAAGGTEALLLCEREIGSVDLLLTDVVMPQMSGRELATRLTELRPSLKVLFMSGYTDDAIVHHGVLARGTHFISKPFSSNELTRRVRETLDG